MGSRAPYANLCSAGLSISGEQLFSQEYVTLALGPSGAPEVHTMHLNVMEMGKPWCRNIGPNHPGLCKTGSV